MSRGRFAHRPTHIPTKGILDVLVRMWNKQTHLNLGLIAAGIAFYGLLSLFPGITAIVAFAGTFLNPEMFVENSEDIAALLPEAAQTIVLGQLRDVANADSSTLSFAALFSLAIALYSASKAVANFIAGLNVIYEERETRNFFCGQGAYDPTDNFPDCRFAGRHHRCGCDPGDRSDFRGLRHH